MDHKDNCLVTLERAARTIDASILMGLDEKRGSSLSHIMKDAVETALANGASPLEIMEVFAENKKKAAIAVLGSNRL